VSALKACLDAPWDAEWIAEKWPHVFSLLDKESGTVSVNDFQALISLAACSGSVGISWEAGGLTLCVFSGCSPLVEA